jgi:hypothetical protein
MYIGTLKLYMCHVSASNCQAFDFWFLISITILCTCVCTTHLLFLKYSTVPYPSVFSRLITYCSYAFSAGMDSLSLSINLSIMLVARTKFSSNGCSRDFPKLEPYRFPTTRTPHTPTTTQQGSSKYLLNGVGSYLGSTVSTPSCIITSLLDLWSTSWTPISSTYQSYKLMSSI